MHPNPGWGIRSCFAPNPGKGRRSKKGHGFLSPQLCRHVDDDVPQTVVGGIVRICQVLLNLVNNAARFTDESSITVSVSLEKVEGRRRESTEALVGLKERSDEQVIVRYSVTDTGVGIAPHVQDKLFEAFMQVGGW